MRKFYLTKLGIYFSLIFILVSLSGFIRQDKNSYFITYSNQEISLKAFFNVIKKQTKLTVFYNNQLLSDQSKVKVSFKKATIESVLNEVLKGKSVDWEINDNFIILKKKNQAPVTLNTTSALKQNIITGKVVDEMGLPVPGVSVKIKNTQKGAITDSDGVYQLPAEAGNTILIFSFVGYEPQEILVRNSRPLAVILKPGANALNEVSVTALGIKREKKSLGYSVQEIKGDVFEKVKEPNIMSSLTGQVAGLTVYNKTGTFDAPTFNIRGSSSILVVIDGVPMGTDTWSINPDDVDKMDVIKGGTGAALYGAQGANGVIMITTKKGGNNPQGLSINFNSSTVFNAGYVVLPEYQTTYGQGLAGQYSPTANQVNIWGPKLNQEDPSSASGFVEYVQWNSPKDPVTGELIPLPWITRNTNPIEEIMESGYTLNNSFSVGGNNELGDFRIGYNNIYKKGNTPNTNLKNQTIDISGGYRFHKKLRVDAKISYNNLSSDNYEDTGYSWDNFILHIGNNLGPNVDLDDLKNYWAEGKEGIIQRTWVAGRNNPYWILNENTHVYNRDRLTGWVKASYEFNKNLNFQARISQVYNSIQQENKENKGNLAVTSNPDGSYSNSANRSTDLNADWLLRYHKNFFSENFGVDALVGGNYRTLNSRGLSAGAPSLIVSDFYNLSNKTDYNSASNNSSSKIVNSLYSTVNLNFQSKIYLGVTGRNDWSSALKSPYNSYFYPSVSLSAIVSEMLKLPQPISFMKLRGSWAVGRNDVDAFWNDQVYSIGNFNGNPTASDGASLFANSLKPSKSENAEVGLDIRFFNNRLAFDMAYYEKKSLDQISTTSISHTSGYTGIRQNGAGILTKGFEYSISGTPIKTQDFSWNSIINLSFYKQYVHSIAPGQTYYADYYRVGERIGRIRGLQFVKNSEGQIIHDNGLPEMTTVYQPIGENEYFDPKLVYGFINRFSYKNWMMNLNIDGRIGGMMYNYMYANMMISGSALQTAEGNVRELPFVGNGVKVIGGEVIRDVRENIVYDSRQYAPNDVGVDYYAWVQKGYKNNYNLNAFDASHLKIREISLGYSLPKKLLAKAGIKGASVAVVGRNLFLWTGVLYTDPDIDNSDAGQGPSVRNVGFNININL
ncbi:SusC/RagA family TonB-linked outer membrane protein [Pedobacter immunditicola]|uniref:SusC/RagA family TonB-linked outer membrane protein n=1 Tax=Pedobacter immunditicola TaxID=3133440 RepID=UPI00309C6453